MKTRRIKRLFIFIISIVLLAGIFGVFFMIIINTPNLDSKITIKTFGVNGTVSSWIRNAENGLPYNYFSFDDTTQEEYNSQWVSNNVQFKGDKETITIELLIKNMSHFKVQSLITFNKPHKNAKIVTYLNSQEVDINNLVFEPNSEQTILLVIGKENFKQPIRAKLKLTINLDPFNEISDNEETT